MSTTELKKKRNRIKVLRVLILEASLEELVIFKRLIDDDLRSYAGAHYEAITNEVLDEKLISKIGGRS